MALWQEILAAAVPILATLGAGIKWLFDKFKELQKNFLDELQKLEDTRERHRQEHLADTKLFAATMAKTTEFLQKLPESKRPPPER